MMELFAKIGNGYRLLPIFKKNSTRDVYQITKDATNLRSVISQCLTFKRFGWYWNTHSVRTQNFLKKLKFLTH